MTEERKQSAIESSRDPAANGIDMAADAAQNAVDILRKLLNPLQNRPNKQLKI